MAIQLQNTAGNVLEVDTAFKAARASLRPPESLSWLSIGATSGLLTGLSVNQLGFSFRNIASNLILVRRVGIGFVTTTAFTTPQDVGWGLIACRSYTASNTVGTIISLTGNNGKHRTALSTLTSVDCRIAAAASLTGAVRVPDANQMAQQTGWSGGVGLTIAPSPDNLLQHNAGDYPLVLGQNEGFEIHNNVLFGAVGVGKLIVNFELAEAASY